MYRVIHVYACYLRNGNWKPLLGTRRKQRASRHPHVQHKRLGRRGHKKQNMKQLDMFPVHRRKCRCVSDIETQLPSLLSICLLGTSRYEVPPVTRELLLAPTGLVAPSGRSTLSPKRWARPTPRAVCFPMAVCDAVTQRCAPGAHMRSLWRKQEPRRKADLSYGRRFPSSHQHQHTDVVGGAGSAQPAPRHAVHSFLNQWPPRSTNWSVGTVTSLDPSA